MKKIEMMDYTKKIKGNIILDHVNYSFEKGKIYGIYGRNGSGKTMLLRAIAGLIYPTSGCITIDGLILHKDMSFPNNVGVIIENTELMPQYDSFTNLKILSRIKKTATDQDIYEVLEKVGLKEAGKKKVKAYSLGMKQKLSIAQAIFEKPDILLLDEPTNALDEKSVEIIRDILQEMRDAGCTILIASHNKEDIAVLSDERLKIVDGKIQLVI